ncbi:MAG: TetR/AcrR family transcriptional regulator [Candidatus Woesearchaeota archaeon]
MSTKDKILATAFMLFARQGFEATGVNQIVSKAKVTKGALYHHFSSKDELLLAVIDYIQEAGREQLQFQAKNKTDFKKKLLDFSQTHQNFIRKNADLLNFNLELLMLARKNADLKKTILAKSDESLQIIVSIVEQGKAYGYFSNQDPKLLVLKIVMMLKSMGIFFSMGIKEDYTSVWKSFVGDVL